MIYRACGNPVGFIGYMVLLWLTFLPTDLNIAHRNVVQDINLTLAYDLNLRMRT